MSGQNNADFRRDTLGFIRKNFITAVRIGPVHRGHTRFDLHHPNDDKPVVTLDAWPTDGTELPIFGYWLPQGSSCLIPREPVALVHVFTPDFSGCSILVDQVTEDEYRVYHVQGGSKYLETEYLDRDHGRGLAGSMTFDDYGTLATPLGFAFLKYESGRWWIYYQSQVGVQLGNSLRNLIAEGPRTVRGGGRLPVADLRSERPRDNKLHSNGTRESVRILPASHNWPQTMEVPSDETW